MAFQSTGLRIIGACQGFALWHYGTTEPLHVVLAPSYFDDAYGLVRSGHHMHVSAAITCSPKGDWLAVPDHALIAVTTARPGHVTVVPLRCCDAAELPVGAP